MRRCWEMHGCNDEMAFECPHDAVGLCPRTCMLTICSLPAHEAVSGMEMLELGVDVDFSAARKENCHNCRFFLTGAPKLDSRA